MHYSNPSPILHLPCKTGILHNMNNYHTHTWRCKHASGTVSDYAKEAEAAGIRILGVSDHTPLPDNRWDFVRMGMDELDMYLGEIQTAAERFPHITLLKGFECDWAQEYRNFYREELFEKRKADYLIGAVHWFPYQGDWLSTWDIENSKHLSAYSSHVIEAMESGLFSFIAHPDSFGIGYKPWDGNALSCSRDIIAAAEECGIILEINGYGLRKPMISTKEGKRRQYPLKGFWELAGASAITAICNSDAHKPEDVAASLEETAKIASDFSVHLTDTLPLRVKVR